MAIKLDKINSIFSKLYNPLAYLNKPEIERLFQNAKHGDDVLLQAVFSEVENLSPIYQVCIQKRLAGIANRKWDVTAIKDDASGATQAQIDYVKDVLLESESRNEDGLLDAIQWLVLANFRGRSVVKPFMTTDGKLILKKLNNWNVLYDGSNFYWNPTAEFVPFLDTNAKDKYLDYDILPLPKSEICWLVSPRPIDYPGLMLYLRQLIGEDQWSRFVEKQGIPQVLLTAPPGTPDTALDVWNMRAMQIYEGGSGTLPPETGVHFATEGRGQDPFSEYCRHQMEIISILATGGTLMTIGGSTGLGSDLASVQKESFNSLVNSDAKRIANAFQQVIKKILTHKFGKNVVVKCKFVFVEDDEYSVADYLEFAKSAKDLGLKIDAAELKRLTKFSFIADDDEVWQPSDMPNDKDAV